MARGACGGDDCVALDDMLMITALPPRFIVQGVQISEPFGREHAAGDK